MKWRNFHGAIILSARVRKWAIMYSDTWEFMKIKHRQLWIITNALRKERWNFTWI